VPSGSWGYLSLGERLRPEDQPRELLSEHPQLVFRADFVELVDHPDQRADMVLGPLSLHTETKITLRPSRKVPFF
jgi:hypothetical protein